MIFGYPIMIVPSVPTGWHVILGYPIEELVLFGAIPILVPFWVMGRERKILVRKDLLFLVIALCVWVLGFAELTSSRYLGFCDFSFPPDEMRFSILGFFGAVGMILMVRFGVGGRIGPDRASFVSFVVLIAVAVGVNRLGIASVERQAEEREKLGGCDM